MESIGSNKLDTPGPHPPTSILPGIPTSMGRVGTYQGVVGVQVGIGRVSRVLVPRGQQDTHLYPYLVSNRRRYIPRRHWYRYGIYGGYFPFPFVLQYILPVLLPYPYCTPSTYSKVPTLGDGRG